MLAFEHAVAAGADVIETDIWQARDGAIVISHDGRVDRTTDGTGRIEELDLEELKALDAGFRWAREGTYPHRGKGVTIPTLSETLEALPDVTVNIDIKDDRPEIIDDLCEVLASHDAENRVIVASFHTKIINRFRERCPNVRTAAHAREILKFSLYSRLGLGRILGPRVHAFQVPLRFGPFRIVTPGFLRAAHRRGIEVHVWTINDPEEILQLARMGVDGIITDFPDRMFNVLRGN